MTLPVKRLTDTAILPTRANPGDAGLDFYADESFSLRHGERRLASTGIAIQLPANTVGYITPRSGLAHKAGVTVLNAPGTVDQGYRGEVKINLINLDEDHKTIEVSAGDRIGQLVVHEYVTLDVAEVEALDDSARGEKGHGSSGR